MAEKKRAKKAKPRAPAKQRVKPAAKISLAKFLPGKKPIAESPAPMNIEEARARPVVKPEIKELPREEEFTDEQLRRMLSPDAKTDLQIERGFEGMKGSYSALVIVENDVYADARMGILRKFVNAEKMPGVYVSVNKAYVKVKAELEKGGISPEKMKFVDLVTRTSDSAHALIEEGKVIYVDSATDLTEIIIAIEKQMDAIKENKKFLILDSLSTLLVYNSPTSVEKFTHSLISKIGQHTTRGALIFVYSKDHEGVIQTISQFCDKVIRVAREQQNW